MNYRFFLNSIINFAYWLAEISRDTLGVLFLPLGILVTVLRVPGSNTVPAIRRLVHKKLHRLKLHAEFIRITLVDGRVSLSLHNYEDEVKAAEEVMNRTKYGSLAEFFDKTLKVAREYMYIVYEINDSALYFFQYMVNDGDYLFDFTLTKHTLNSECARDVIALLQRRGFEKSLIPGYPVAYKTYGIVRISDEMTSISADCGTDRALAAALSAEIYSHIFNRRGYPHICLG